MAVTRILGRDPLANRSQDQVRDAVNPLIADSKAMKIRATDIEAAAAALEVRVTTAEADIAALDTRVGALEAKPILKNVILTAQVLAPGDNTLTHGLGRAPIGWIPIMVSAATALYDKQATNANASTTLILNSSAATTVSLYVF